MKKNTRNQSVDFIKGILILLVVFGHGQQFIVHRGLDAVFDDPIFRFIYMFHMPLFMAMSGYTVSTRFEQDSALFNISTRMRQILLPMAVWCGVLTLARLLTNTSHENSFFGQFLVYFRKEYWFLWAAFIASSIVALFFAIVRSPVKSTRITGTTILASALLACVLLAPLLPPLHLVFFVFPFFLAGMAFRGIRSNQWAHPLVLFALGLVVLLIWMAWTTETYIYVNQLDLVRRPGQVALMFTGAVAASTFVWGMLSKLYDCLGRGSAAMLGIQQRVVVLGRKTLEIYLVQTVAFVAISSAVTRTSLLTEIQPMALWVISFLICAGIVWGSTVLVQLTSRSQIAALLFWGKSRHQLPDQPQHREIAKSTTTAGGGLP